MKNETSVSKGIAQSKPHLWFSLTSRCSPDDSLPTGACLGPEGVGDPLFCGSVAAFCCTSGACCFACLSLCLFWAAFTSSNWNSGEETLRFAKNAEAAALIGGRGLLSSIRRASFDGAGLLDEVCAFVLNRRVFFGAPEPVSSHPRIILFYLS